MNKDVEIKRDIQYLVNKERICWPKIPKKLVLRKWICWKPSSLIYIHLVVRNSIINVFNSTTQYGSLHIVLKSSSFSSSQKEYDSPQNVFGCLRVSLWTFFAAKSSSYFEWKRLSKNRTGHIFFFFSELLNVTEIKLALMSLIDDVNYKELVKNQNHLFQG